MNLTVNEQEVDSRLLYNLGVSWVLNAHITRPARSNFKTFNENGEFGVKPN